MKISLKTKGVSGIVEIPAGDYMVALLSDSGQFNLAGKGKDIKIPATRRRANSKSKSTSVQFYCGGGSSWSLVYSAPNEGEWIAAIELKKDDRTAD